MKNKRKSLILAGLTGAVLAPSLPAAQINLVTVGGNASIKLIQNRIPTILTSAVITSNPTNSLLWKATGSYAGKTVDWEFNFTGGAGAISDIANSTPVILEDGVSTGVPQLAISATAPETVGIDSTAYNEDYTVVVPVAFVKNAALTTINKHHAKAGFLPGKFGRHIARQLL